MISRHQRSALLAATAFTALLPSGTASAQAVSGGSPASSGAATTATTPPDNTADTEIVVVGTAGQGVRRQNAAFAVTTVDSAAVERLAPQSTADLLRVVPGISVESSGGQNGANIFVRGFPSGGDAEFVTFQLEGVPIFPPPTLSFLENSQLVRFDETLERVEAVRGGTGALFGAGQPGLTVNVVQKKGGQDFHGLAQVSGEDYGTVRGDAFVSGPIDANTTFLVGGYYAQGNGIRDPRFTAEQGGQISANIRHTFTGGELLVWGRYLNDHGQWLLPIPISTSANGRQISGYPGFPYGTGTFIGRDNRFSTRNDGSQVDLAKGRGAKIGNVGFNAELEVTDGVKLRDRFSWLGGTADTTGFVPAGTPTTAGAVAAGLGSTIGTLTFATGGGNAGGASTPVGEAGVWTVRKDIDAEVNDAALEWTHNRNTLTVGAYFSHTYTRDAWNLGNTRLITLTPNAQVLNLTLANGQIATRDGFLQGSFYKVNARYDGYDYAGYVSDEWRATDKLKLDGGFRWQEHDVDGRIQNLASANLDGNPNTLYDNNDTVFAPGFAAIRYRGNDFAATAGIDYEQNEHLGAFARYSRGNIFPFFDNLRSGLSLIERVDSYEIGLKATYSFGRAYVTLFHNDFTGLATTQITNGAPITSQGGARANGVEVEGALTPLRGLSIGFATTYLDATYRNFFSNGGLTNDSGNQVQRQPQWNARITPAYEFPITDRVKASLFSSVEYTGDRFSDVENQQTLPHYLRWDLGAAVTVAERLTFQVNAENLTDELGLTEGNPRVIGSQGSGVIYARPILGRSFRFAASYKF